MLAFPGSANFAAYIFEAILWVVARPVGSTGLSNRRVQSRSLSLVISPRAIEPYTTTLASAESSPAKRAPSSPRRITVVSLAWKIAGQSLRSSDFSSSRYEGSFIKHLDAPQRSGAGSARICRSTPVYPYNGREFPRLRMLFLFRYQS